MILYPYFVHHALSLNVKCHVLSLNVQCHVLSLNVQCHVLSLNVQCHVLSLNVQRLLNAKTDAIHFILFWCNFIDFSVY